MTLLACGFVMVIVDVHFGGVDAVPDLVGWLLCAAGLLGVRRRSSWFDLAILACLAGCAAGYADLASPPSGWIVRDVDAVATTVLVFATCSGILGTVADRQTRVVAARLRWLVLALIVLGLLLVGLAAEGFGIGVPELVVLGLPAIYVMVRFPILVNGISYDGVPRGERVPEATR